MCGICGAVNFNHEKSIAKGPVLDMLRHLQHRGPDDEGLFVDENVAFGHRRLSIIDLETGHQPLFNEDRSVCAIVNGEIYNYLELRKDLERKHTFSTRSDSEIIIHLWEEFEEQCVDYLRGMFAFVLYDLKKKVVFMARDRFGQKPLMYAQTPDGLYFSSEIYPLTQIPRVNTAMNHQALDDFLALRYVPAPHTIHEGIMKLPPAHTLTVSVDGVRLNRYWSIDPYARSGDTYQVAEEKVFGLLEEAVRYRMISDVPVGGFLSGGVDSSIIVALMRRGEPSGDLQTVCMGFDEPRYDERPFAGQVADRFETTHHEHVVTPDVMEILPKLVRHYGEPYGDASAIPTWYLSQIAAGHVKVALSGDGGDEIFAGYNRFDSTRIVEILQKIGMRPLESPMAMAAKALPRMSWGEAYLSQMQHFLLGASQHPAQRFILRNTVFTPEMKQAVYTEKLKEALSGYTPANRFFTAHSALGRLSECEKLQNIDLVNFLPDDILTKIDIASMAHGLEVRSPFLDHKLAEYALSLPFHYHHRMFRRKRILKRVGRRFFSSDFLNRKKKGFRLPISAWFRTSLKKSLAEALQSAPIFAHEGLFNGKAVMQLLAEHESGRINHTDRLWSLWFLGEWSKLETGS